MKKLRQASAETMEARASLRAAMSSETGICPWAIAWRKSSCSCSLISERKVPGISASTRLSPSVSPPAMRKPPRCSSTSSRGRSTKRTSASTASTGMVNSAMTRMEETVRNLLYSGT